MLTVEKENLGYFQHSSVITENLKIALMRLTEKVSNMLPCKLLITALPQ
jgi:hypothetical protein